MNPVLPSALAILAYVAATLGLWWRMRRVAGGQGINKIPIIGVAIFAGIAHAVAIYLAIHAPHGINLGFFNALSLEGWLIALLVTLAATRQPVENLGVALYPLAILSLLSMVAFQSDEILPIAPGSPLQIHILLSIGAYGVLTIAAVQAGALAIQDRSLRNHQPGGLIRALPPLRVMETLLFHLIGVGFALLTMALLTGILFLEDMFAQHLVHKTVLSLIAWAVFAVLLWGRVRHGWRGRKAIRWTLGGFILLLLAYFGSKAVLELILKTPMT
ncbi:MAG: cytochrome c biogenesis protein CcsA [Gammaproteobacteria bacterium]|nr:cytochrome c biogenesis protein CcsA [Gammaproteobacteria bacterium]MCP5135948.1 cytochrome c biogenesis protein CcsA [Gammaproteobacteria bacterium]